MIPEKITIRVDGINVLTIDNCSGEQPTSFNVPSINVADIQVPSVSETQVTEGVRRVVSEYGEALRRLSNE